MISESVALAETTAAPLGASVTFTILHLQFTAAPALRDRLHTFVLEWDRPLVESGSDATSVVLPTVQMDLHAPSHV